MKKILLFALLFVPTTIMAQQDKDASAGEESLFEKITKIEKKQDNFHFLLNLNNSFDVNQGNGEFQNAKFNMRQIRIEAKGNFNKTFSFRWRQRLNRNNSPAPDGIDNMPSSSIDVAGIGVRTSDVFSMFLGKQCAAYGGIEFDLNPIEIYEYSDMVDYMSNFLTGANFQFQVHPNHQLQLQVLDSRSASMEDMYGQGYEQSKVPLLYTVNWNGSFGGVFNTRWSYSIMSQAKSYQSHYIALGNELNLDKFNAFFDIMYMREGIDREGIVSGIVGNNPQGGHLNDAEYLSFVLKAQYRFSPKWNVFVKGMLENEGLSKANGVIEKGKYRTAYGYLAGLEFYPLNNSNLHFFLTYVGRSYSYTDRAKAYGADNYSTNRISLGYIWQLPMF
ncbi:MAG: OprO/OprP family phosphate-selective porin [Prevotella sp.]|nr:OprO/OprP family phosphate-selective porin [Prevotella sp.]